jgi:Protein of unknown function (DUF1553)/Protein of unknown function (DUF1549)/Bacterial Ig-like domain (group 2)
MLLLWASLPSQSGTASSQIAKLSIYPEQAEIRWAEGYQTLVVTATDAVGLETDVTSQVRLKLDSDVVQITSDSRAIPVRDGHALVSATYGDRSATAQIAVTGSNRRREVSFLRDVAPILTQRGCTGSNCHGSVRGKNGFKLSLFGARPDLDFEAITTQDDGRRLNLLKPEASLLLRKPTFEEPHGGGERFKVGSLEYQTIFNWISSGRFYDSGGPELKSISVFPSERILLGPGSRQRLVVLGIFSDGSRIDMTRQVRFTSNDENIAIVDDHGEVTAKQRGETAIMVRTQGKAGVAKFVVSLAAPSPSYPRQIENNFIDSLVFGKLKRLNMLPSELADDSVFLRRIYLDLLGVLPTPDETRQFLASLDSQKRAQLIDALLVRKEFVDLWSMKMADLFQLGASDVKGGWQLYRWIRQAISENRPFDQMVRQLVGGAGAFVYDPEVNFYKGLWEGPEGMVTQVSQSLLGIRMDCAKCHDHPFEAWTQDDFYGMAAFFTHLEYKAESYGLFERSIAVRPTRQPSFDYVNNNKEVVHPKTKAPLSPRFLGGAVVEASAEGDLREKLAEWLTSPQNPWFARAIANRIWRHFLGRGIVEPVDDFRVTNPPSNVALLDALAAHLVKERYDVRKLIKAIVNSRTYQLSSVPNPTNDFDEINYSRFYLKRQIAEVLFDAMGQAADVRQKIPGYPPGKKAISIGVGSPSYFLMTFGKVDTRDQICERDHQPNVAQAMHLVNGDTVNNLVTAPENIVDRVLAKTDWTDERRIQDIYLAALSRYPTSNELEELRSRLGSDPAGRRKAYQDLLWALLNSKEFAYIH